MNRIQQKLIEPVDNSPLVLFRALFGFLLSCEVLGKMFSGWVHRLYIYPKFHFTFMGFEWLQPLPGIGMYAYFVIMALLAWMIMLGWKHRFAAAAFFIMWTAVYLMQKSYYNNHDYLYSLLSAVMIFMPASNNFSLASRINPSIKSLSCPRWCLWFFIAQLWIVYLFASIAKMNPDWMAGRPMEIWFGHKEGIFLFGNLLQSKGMQLLISYGGILFDFAIVPLLLWNKTRKFFLPVYIAFHLSNSILFNIGTFPYMMIAMSVFFFPTERIRSIFFKKRTAFVPKLKLKKEEPVMPKYLVYSLGIYFLIQIALPLRHNFIPGEVTWTEEGHRLSWRMMVRSKKGDISYKIIDQKTKVEEHVDPQKYLTRGQTKALATKPDMIWQFAQFLKNKYEEQGTTVEVYAISSLSLNGHPPKPLVDSNTDLAKVHWNYFSGNKWILPFDRDALKNHSITYSNRK